jgi:hypothetical protein
MIRLKALTFLAVPLLALSLLATGCGKVKPGSRTAPAGVKENPRANSSGSPSAGSGSSNGGGSTGGTGIQYKYWTCGFVEGDSFSQQYWISLSENGVSVRVNLMPVDSSAQMQIRYAYGRQSCAYGDQAYDSGPQTSYLQVKRVQLY